MMRRLAIAVLCALALPAQAALTKTYAGAAGVGGTSGTTVSLTGVNSTGYTHEVACIKDEGGGATTVTMSDNKSSGSWTAYTPEVHTNNDLMTQCFMVKIGSPGASHDITATWGAARTHRTLVVWFVNASATCTLALDVEGNGEGTGADPDFGSLVTSGASVVAFEIIGEYAAVNYTALDGWTKDLDMNGMPNYTGAFSQGPVTTTPIDPKNENGAVSMDWTQNAVAFNEAAGSCGGGLSIPIVSHNRRMRANQ